MEIMEVQGNLNVAVNRISFLTDVFAAVDGDQLSLGNDGIYGLVEELREIRELVNNAKSLLEEKQKIMIGGVK